MGSEKPCCPAAAARMVRKLSVGGSLVGVVELETVLDEVGRLHPASDEEAKAALLTRAKIYNYVPPKVEGDYAEALLKEYRMTRPREGG